MRTNARSSRSRWSGPPLFQGDRANQTDGSRAAGVGGTKHPARRRRSRILLGSLGLALAVLLAFAGSGSASGVTTRVGETRINGGAPVVSANGRFVVYWADDARLLLFDRSTGVSEQVNVDSVETPGGGGGTGLTTVPSISADGRFVSFTSRQSNLVPNDTNPNDELDVFVRDRTLGITELANVSTAGAQSALGLSFFERSDMSADGRYVCFAYTGSDLVAGDTNVQTDVFVRDRLLSTTTRVSVRPDGSQIPNAGGNGVNRNCAISPNGRFVAFQLPGAVTTSTAPIGLNSYLRDRQAGTTTLVTTRFGTTDPATTGGTLAMDVTDNRLVLFRGASPEFVPGDTNGVDDIFVRDMSGSTTERVSVSSAETEANGQSVDGGISSDGRFVVFGSDAPNLVANDTNAPGQDVFMRDRSAGTTLRVSVASDGSQAAGSSFSAGFDGGTSPVSGGGGVAVFTSMAANLSPGDTNGAPDVFIHDRYVSPVAIPVGQVYGGCENSLGSTNVECVGEDGGDEDVDGAHGGLTQSVTDARLPGRGVTFSFTRNYTSPDAEAGSLGPAWTHPYQAAATVYLNGDVRVRAEDGQRGLFVSQPDGSFATPAGLTSTLTRTGGEYTLKSLDESRVLFDTAGRLIGMLDRTGQGLSFTYTGSDMTGITDAEGKQVTLTYDATSHALAGIQLPDGRMVGYSYLPDGRLSGVTDLRGGATTYTYDAAGRLDGVRDQLNHWTVRVVYDAAGRVVEKRDALENLTTYAWNEATTTHTRTDPRGGAWQEVYFGNVLIRRVDPLGNTTTYGYDTQNNLIATTDARGNTTHMSYDIRGNMLMRMPPGSTYAAEAWTYDTSNRPLTYTNGRGHTTTYAYHANGDLWKQTDAKGGIAEFTYTADGQVATAKDARGNLTTNTYDPATRKLVRVTTPLGHATVYEYDSFGRLAGQIDPRGQVAGANPLLFRTAFTYNDADQQTSVRDPRGNMTITTYDLAGREETVTDALGKVTVYGYDAADRRTSVTDPNSGVTRTEYDAVGNVTATVSATDDRTTFAFDLAGRQTGMTTPRGNVAGGTPVDYTWGYTYDANGNRTVVRDPLGHETTTTYDAVNRPATVTDPRGKTTATVYDANGNPVSVTNPLGHVSAATYDELDRKATTTTPRGKIGSTTYDEVGNVTSDTTPLGNKTTYTYDADDRQITMVEPRGNVAGANPATYTWTTTYDPAGNRLTERSPLNHTTTHAYDATNNQTSQLDPLGRTTTRTYDELNRLRAVTGPDAPTCATGPECVAGKKSTVYAYDDAGNLTTRTDPKAHVTAYTYDQSKRLKQTLSPTSQKWTYAYDPDGNQTQTITARGNANPNPALGTITKVYDRRGKLTNITFGDGTTPNVAFAYDTAGRLQSMTDGAGVEAYTLDDADRVTQITRGGESFAYVYDNDGNVTSRTYPDTTAHAATFDDDGRLATITSGGVVTSFTYDAGGNLTTTTLPSGNGHIENRVYDASGRITKVESIKGNKILVGVTQTLDAAGNPTLIATKRGNTTTNQTYTYDTADRITRNCVDITTACTATAAKRIEYTYDPVGNRLTQNRVGVTTPGSTTSTYNNADQLTQTVSGATTTPYTYDADGNQTSVGAKTSTYDLANRLRSAVSGATTTTYTYDGQGKRLTRATNGTIDTKFSWDPAGPLPELALERTGANALIRRYVQGPDGPVSLTTPAGAFYYHRDPIGSIRAVTNSTGAEQWKHDYDPYGENRLTTKVVTTAPANPVLFAGEALDTETSLYHLRARQYDSATGRFTAVDPVAPKIADPYAASYIYAAARPNVLTDPRGEDPWARECGPSGEFCSANFYNLVKWNPGRVCLEYPHHPNCRVGGDPQMLLFLASFVVAPEAIVAGVATKALTLTPKGLKTFRAWRAKRAGAGAGVAASTADDLAKAAARARARMGAGSGPVHGTRTHTAFADEVAALGRTDLLTEISYRGGVRAARGSKGSVRLDVVEGSLMQPKVIYDLKTGSARLTAKRIAQIRRHLPKGYQNIPVREIR